MANELFHGIGECVAKIEEIQAKTDKATVAALKASQNAAKAQIKSGMRGRPRWDKRGAIGRNKTVPAVNLKRTPHHISRSGGPGSLTGHLRGAVGGVRRPVRKGFGYSGGVGVGGKESITQVYRKVVEGGYPYMKPGVTKAQPKIRAAFERAWAKATET